MEESELSRSSCESSPCVTNVKKFVEDFEHKSPVLREENDPGGSEKKRETMTKTSFRKLNELKKNLEQSMRQRYASSRGLHSIGKPISELKDALKKSMENLSSKSFVFKPSPAVRMRNKDSAGQTNNSDINNRRLSLSSAKFKPIPFPKPKTSFKAKKFKSISDLLDTKQSVIFKSLDLNETNDVFDQPLDSEGASRLSCGFSRTSECSNTSSEHSKMVTQSSTYSSDSSTDSPEYSDKNSIFFQDPISSTLTIEQTNESAMNSDESAFDKRKSLKFETIGESSTDHLDEEDIYAIKEEENSVKDKRILSKIGESESVSMKIEEPHDNFDENESSFVNKIGRNGISKKGVRFDFIGESCTDDIDDDNDDTLQSTTDLETTIPMSASSNYSESSDAIETGTYYISQLDYTNFENDRNSSSSAFTESSDPEYNVDVLAVENSPKDEDIRSNLTNSPSKTLPSELQSTFLSHSSPKLTTAGDEQQSLGIENKDHMMQHSNKKPCLKVSPLQSIQQQQPPPPPSHKQTPSREQLTPFEISKATANITSISASHITNQGLCCNIHCYLQSVITSLSSSNHEDKHSFDAEVLSSLFSHPLSGFDAIADVFSIQYSPSQDTYPEKNLQPPSKEELVEVGSSLMDQLETMAAMNKCEVEAQQRNISKLKEMVEGSVVEVERDACVKRMDEFLKQVDSVVNLLFLLNRMMSRKKYNNLKSLKNNPDEVLQSKLSDAKDLKGMMDEKYSSMLAFLTDHSNQETCDFYVALIQSILSLKFEGEYISHKLFQLQRLLNLLNL